MLRRTPQTRIFAAYSTRRGKAAFFAHRGGERESVSDSVFAELMARTNFDPNECGSRQLGD
jgi:hypothetical protein